MNEQRLWCEHDKQGVDEAAWWSIVTPVRGHARAASGGQCLWRRSVGGVNAYARLRISHDREDGEGSAHRRQPETARTAQAIAITLNAGKTVSNVRVAVGSQLRWKRQPSMENMYPNQHIVQPLRRASISFAGELDPSSR